MMLTREKMKTIKGYNREQLSKFLEDIYNDGYNAGISSITKELAVRVDTGIKNTPGIGEKRYNDLITNINKELNREGN